MEDSKVSMLNIDSSAGPVELREDGTLRYAVSFFDDESGQLRMGQLTPQACIDVWRRKGHRHQQKGLPKPDYLHTDRELEQFLAEARNDRTTPAVRGKSKLSRLLHNAVLATGGIPTDDVSEGDFVEDYVDPVLPATSEKSDTEVESDIDEMEDDSMIATPTTDPGIRNEYRKAAKFIRDQGKDVTPGALDDALSLPPGTAANFIAANPDYEMDEKTGSDDSDAEHDEDMGEESHDEETTPTPKRRSADRETFLARIRAAPKGEPNAYLQAFPPVEQTAQKFAAYAEEDRALIRDSSSKEWRKGLKGQRQQELGTSPALLAKRLKSLMQGLGLENQRNVKKYLRRVLRYFDRHEDELRPKPEATQRLAAEAAGSAPPPSSSATELPATAARSNGRDVAFPMPQGPVMPAVREVSVSGTVMVIPPGVKKVIIEF